MRLSMVFLLLVLFSGTGISSSTNNNGTDEKLEIYNATTNGSSVTIVGSSTGDDLLETRTTSHLNGELGTTFPGLDRHINSFIENSTMESNFLGETSTTFVSVITNITPEHRNDSTGKGSESDTSTYVSNTITHFTGENNNNNGSMSVSPTVTSVNSATNTLYTSSTATPEPNKKFEDVWSNDSSAIHPNHISSTVTESGAHILTATEPILKPINITQTYAKISSTPTWKTVLSSKEQSTIKSSTMTIVSETKLAKTNTVISNSASSISSSIIIGNKNNTTTPSVKTVLNGSSVVASINPQHHHHLEKSENCCSILKSLPLFCIVLIVMGILIHSE